MRVTASDIHPHLKARMEQRGISSAEIERALNEGWNADDAKPGGFGKILAFTYQALWEGKFYEE